MPTSYEILDSALAQPVLKRELFPDPVVIASVELLRDRGSFICRVRSTDGAEGISIGHPFGMTGSRKTGLGIGLIEEALIDNIPVIAVDPKGDLPNLLLTFPDLAPQDFRPWVNPQDAAIISLRGKGLLSGEIAQATEQVAHW